MRRKPPLLRAAVVVLLLLLAPTQHVALATITASTASVAAVALSTNADPRVGPSGLGPNPYQAAASGVNSTAATVPGYPLVDPIDAVLPVMDAQTSLQRTVLHVDEGDTVRSVAILKASAVTGSGPYFLGCDLVTPTNAFISLAQVFYVTASDGSAPLAFGHTAIQAEYEFTTLSVAAALVLMVDVTFGPNLHIPTRSQRADSAQVVCQYGEHDSPAAMGVIDVHTSTLETAVQLFVRVVEGATVPLGDNITLEVSVAYAEGAFTLEDNFVNVDVDVVTAGYSTPSVVMDGAELFTTVGPAPNDVPYIQSFVTLQQTSPPPLPLVDGVLRLEALLSLTAAWTMKTAAVAVDLVRNQTLAVTSVHAANGGLVGTNDANTLTIVMDATAHAPNPAGAELTRVTVAFTSESPDWQPSPAVSALHCFDAASTGAANARVVTFIPACLTPLPLALPMLMTFAGALEADGAVEFTVTAYQMVGGVEIVDAFPLSVRAATFANLTVFNPTLLPTTPEPGVFTPGEPKGVAFNNFHLLLDVPDDLDVFDVLDASLLAFAWNRRPDGVLVLNYSGNALATSVRLSDLQIDLRTGSTVFSPGPDNHINYNLSLTSNLHIGAEHRPLHAHVPLTQAAPYMVVNTTWPSVVVTPSDNLMDVYVTCTVPPGLYAPVYGLVFTATTSSGVELLSKALVSTTSPGTAIQSGGNDDFGPNQLGIAGYMTAGHSLTVYMEYRVHVDVLLPGGIVFSPIGMEWNSSPTFGPPTVTSYVQVSTLSYTQPATAWVALLDEPGDAVQVANQSVAYVAAGGVVSAMVHVDVPVSSTQHVGLLWDDLIGVAMRAIDVDPACTTHSLSPSVHISCPVSASVEPTFVTVTLGMTATASMPPELVTAPTVVVRDRAGGDSVAVRVASNVTLIQANPVVTATAPRLLSEWALGREVMVGAAVGVTGRLPAYDVLLGPVDNGRCCSGASYDTSRWEADMGAMPFTPAAFQLRSVAHGESFNVSFAMTWWSHPSAPERKQYSAHVLVATLSAGHVTHGFNVVTEPDRGSAWVYGQQAALAHTLTVPAGDSRVTVQLSTLGAADAAQVLPGMAIEAAPGVLWVPDDARPATSLPYLAPGYVNSFELAAPGTVTYTIPVVFVQPAGQPNASLTFAASLTTTNGTTTVFRDFTLAAPNVSLIPRDNPVAVAVDAWWAPVLVDINNYSPVLPVFNLSLSNATVSDPAGTSLLACGVPARLVTVGDAVHPEPPTKVGTVPDSTAVTLGPTAALRHGCVAYIEPDAPWNTTLTFTASLTLHTVPNAVPQAPLASLPQPLPAATVSVRTASPAVTHVNVSHDTATPPGRAVPGQRVFILVSVSVPRGVGSDVSIRLVDPTGVPTPALEAATSSVTSTQFGITLSPATQQTGTTWGPSDVTNFGYGNATFTITFDAVVASSLPTAPDVFVLLRFSGGQASTVRVPVDLAAPQVVLSSVFQPAPAFEAGQPATLATTLTVLNGLPVFDVYLFDEGLSGTPRVSCPVTSANPLSEVRGSTTVHCSVTAAASVVFPGFPMAAMVTWHWKVHPSATGGLQQRSTAELDTVAVPLVTAVAAPDTVFSAGDQVEVAVGVRFPYGTVDTAWLSAQLDEPGVLVWQSATEDASVDLSVVGGPAANTSSAVAYQPIAAPDVPASLLFVTTYSPAPALPPAVYVAAVTVRLTYRRFVPAGTRTEAHVVNVTVDTRPALTPAVKLPAFVGTPGTTVPVTFVVEPTRPMTVTSVTHDRTNSTGVQLSCDRVTPLQFNCTLTILPWFRAGDTPDLPVNVTYTPDDVGLSHVMTTSFRLPAEEPRVVAAAVTSGSLQRAASRPNTTVTVYGDTLTWSLTLALPPGPHSYLRVEASPDLRTATLPDSAATPVGDVTATALWTGAPPHVVVAGHLSNSALLSVQPFGLVAPSHGVVAPLTLAWRTRVSPSWEPVGGAAADVLEVAWNISVTASAVPAWAQPTVIATPVVAVATVPLQLEPVQSPPALTPTGNFTLTPMRLALSAAAAPYRSALVWYEVTLRTYVALRGMRIAGVRTDGLSAWPTRAAALSATAAPNVTVQADDQVIMPRVLASSVTNITLVLEPLPSVPLGRHLAVTPTVQWLSHPLGDGAEQAASLELPHLNTVTYPAGALAVAASNTASMSGVPIGQPYSATVAWSRAVAGAVADAELRLELIRAAGSARCAFTVPPDHLVANCSHVPPSSAPGALLVDASRAECSHMPLCAFDAALAESWVLPVQVTAWAVNGANTDNEDTRVHAAMHFPDVTIAATASPVTMHLPEACAADEYVVRPFVNGEDDQVCGPCHPACAACTGSAAVQCTQCREGYFEQDGACEPCDTCGVGQFTERCNSDEGVVCGTCLPDCDECAGGGQCTTCAAGHFLQVGPSVACAPCTNATSCPLGTFLQSACTATADGVCALCADGCQQCTGPNVDECVSCVSNFYLAGSTCAPCSSASCDGSFLAAYCSATADMQCGVCHASCATCSGPGPQQCVSCPPGGVHLPDSGTCLDPLANEVELMTAPVSPTASSSAVFHVVARQYQASCVAPTCNVTCTLDAQPLPCELNEDVAVATVSTGLHVFVANVSFTDAPFVVTRHTWEVNPAFVDLTSTRNWPLVGGSVQLALAERSMVTATPTAATFRVQLPMAPAATETVTVSCTSSDATVVVVSPPVVFRRDSWARRRDVVVSAVPDALNDEPALQPFVVVCAVVSTAAVGGSRAFGNGVARRINGTVHNVLLPHFQDVYALRRATGQWESSVTAPSGSFALTLSTNTTLAFVADNRFRLPAATRTVFTPDVAVAIAGIDTQVLAMYTADQVAAAHAPPARLLSAPQPHTNATAPVLPLLPPALAGSAVDVVVVQSPQFQEVFPDACDADAVQCHSPGGYVAIQLVNGDAAADGAAGGAVQCPPACPGFGDAAHDAAGLFYTPTCAGFPPSDQRCVQPETASQCAYGFGDTCRRCPPGAMCPGGLRLWPRPNYWIASQFDAAVHRCDFDDRCTGWNTTLASSGCVPGYSPAAPKCESCAEDYFLEQQLCEPCPTETSDVWGLVGAFVGVMALLFLAVFAMVLLATRQRGGTVGNGVFRARDFVMWTMITWQTIVQVGHRSTYTHPTLRKLYARITIFELNAGSVVHPSCLASHPFATELYYLVTSVSVCGILVVLFAVAHPCATTRLSSRANKHLAVCRRLGMSLLTLLYPLVANTALASVNCRVDDASGDLRLQSNTFYTCYEGQHAAVGALAWLAIILHVAAFPLATFWYLRSAIRTDLSMRPTHWRATWRSFLLTQFEVKYFWFAQVNQLSLLLLSLALVFGYGPDPALQTVTWLFTTAVLGLHVVALLYYKPYLQRKRWILHVKVLTVVVALLGSLLNFIGYWDDQTDDLNALVTALSFILLATFAMLAVVFLVSFVRSLLEGAAVEQRAIVRRSLATSKMPTRANPMHVLKPLPVSGPVGTGGAPGSPGTLGLSLAEVTRARRTSVAVRFTPQAARRSTTLQHFGALAKAAPNQSPLPVSGLRSPPPPPQSSTPRTFGAANPLLPASHGRRQSPRRRRRAMKAELASRMRMEEP